MKNINNNDAAGSWSLKKCPGCGKENKVYFRSFWGNGKKCIHCKQVFEPIPYSGGQVRLRYNSN